MMEDAEVQLRQLAERAKEDGRRLSGEDIAAWYRAVGELRRQADFYERGLIRYLRYDLLLRWRDIADLVGVESKQGAHQRWRRLAPDVNREVRRGGSK